MKFALYSCIFPVEVYSMCLRIANLNTTFAISSKYQDDLLQKWALYKQNMLHRILYPKVQCDVINYYIKK